MIGLTLDGKYRLLRLLGEGGMGSVYAARNLDDGSLVAVKLINAEALARSPGLVKRFHREARTTAKIDTPNIVRVFDSGVDSATESPYMAMEFLRGFDLLAFARQVGPVAPDTVLRIAAQACLGLAAAHAAGVIHRDIKPANIFLARTDPPGAVTVKVLDFGIAKSTLDPGSGETQGLTRTGTLLGSPLYMSPEQARGAKRVEARARAAAPAPKLAYLTVTLDTGADASGLVVKRNGVEMKSELSSTRVPIDPGSYTLEASAPGKKTWTTRIDIPASPGARAVKIPVLEDAPPAAVAPAPPASPAVAPPPAATPRTWTTPRVLGAVAGGVAITAFGMAGIFSARALSKDAEADEHCDGTRCRDLEGVELSKSARSAADVSSVMVGVGGAALITGVILFFTASSPAPARASLAPRFTPIVGAGAGGVRIGGQF